MGPFDIILTVLLFLSGVLTVFLVLMHSGKGTGVSEMIASSLYNSGTGSGVLEKNLNRLTVISVAVCFASEQIFNLVRKNWLHIITDDSGENYNRADVYPEIAAEMKQAMEDAMDEFKANRRGVNKQYYK